MSSPWVHRIRTTKQAARARARVVESIELRAATMMLGTPPQVRAQAFLDKRAENAAKRA